MKHWLNLLAFIASLLMSTGSSALRFFDHWRLASIVVSVAGVGLGWFCIRAGRTEQESRPATSFISRFPFGIIAISFVAFGLPEFYGESIAQQHGATLAVLIATKTLFATATFYLIWLHIRRLPRESTHG